MAVVQPIKPKERDFAEESVSAGRLSFSAEALNPQTVAYELSLFNHQMARLMRFDAEVHAAIEFLVDAILSDGIGFVGAAFEDNPEFALSEEIKDFVYRCLVESPQTPFLPTLKELVRGAITFGHKTAEIVMRAEKQGIDRGKRVLDRLKVKPNEAVIFVVDEFDNVIGFLGQEAKFSAPTPGSIDPRDPRIFPPEKFFVCTLEKENSDPRGISQLRAAMKPFLDKQETRQQYSVYRRKCAVRSFIGQAPEFPVPLAVYNADGTPMMLANGTQKTITATQSIADTLAKMANDTVGVFPFGTNVTALDADGTGEQFKTALDIQNREIRKSILLQTQATGDAEKGGLGTLGHVTHDRILGRRVKSFRTILSDSVYDLSRTFVVLNYGIEKAHLTPKPDFGEFDRTNLQAKLYAAVQAEYKLDQSQFAELDSEFLFPARSSNWMEEAAAREAKAKTTAPTAPQKETPE